MNINFKASQAQSLTRYAKMLLNISNEIQTAARKGNSKIFTNIPTHKIESTKISLKKAGYFVTERGTVTMNNTHFILIKVEW